MTTIEPVEDWRSRFGTEAFTQADARRFCDELSEHVGDWQGIPVMLGEDMPLVLAKGHPLEPIYRQLNQTGGVEIELLVDDKFECRPGDVTAEERIVNEWYSWRLNARVLIVDRGGKRFALKVPVAPDRSMDRLTYWIQTIGAADAWDLEAERRARETLRSMLSERQWMHYDLTGSFFESSPRSRLTYVFRRLRPTIAMTGRSKRDGVEREMRVLAVLCMHPIGYYAQTWAGCMVPSDDVIAHLSWMRGDEARFWKHATQHDPASPEAGL